MDLKMTVYRIDEGGKVELRCVDFAEVAMIVPVESRKMAYYVDGQIYYSIVSLEDLEEGLERSNYDFYLLDRSNLVNMGKIKQLDEVYGKVYFEENPDKNSLFANIARVTLSSMRQLIRRFIARNNESTIEFELRNDASRCVAPKPESRR